MNRLAFFIATRYARSKRRLNFITIISSLSTLGIAIGVAALIVVLAVFNGFSALVTSYLISLDPHIRIEAISEYGLQTIDSLPAILKTFPQITAISPAASGKIILRAGGDVRVVTARGTSAKALNDVYGMDKYIFDGKTFSDTTNTPRMMIGHLLADYLGIAAGDTVTLVSPSNIDAIITQGALPLVSKAVVSGTFYSKNNEYDISVIFLQFPEAARLFGMEHDVQGYDIRLNDLNDAKKVKAGIASKISGNDYTIKTWSDLHDDLFTVMVIERWAAYFLLSLIVVVAVFNILASLTMTVIEKKRNIGIMRAMGMTPAHIKRIYLFHGLIVGAIGTIGGFILGLFIYWLQVTYIIYPLDPTKFKISALPMQLQGMDFIFVGIASMGLSLLAAIIPANKAARVDALDAIRWE